jgi:hypothetical protein
VICFLLQSRCLRGECSRPVSNAAHSVIASLRNEKRILCVTQGQIYSNTIFLNVLESNKPFFFSFDATALIWASPFHFGLLDLRRSVGLLGRVISSSLYTNTEKRTPNIHALSEIRTHDPGFRASEDRSATVTGQTNHYRCYFKMDQDWFCTKRVYAINFTILHFSVILF